MISYLNPNHSPGPQGGSVIRFLFYPATRISHSHAESVDEQKMNILPGLILYFIRSPVKKIETDIKWIRETGIKSQDVGGNERLTVECANSD